MASGDDKESGAKESQLSVPSRLRRRAREFRVRLTDRLVRTLSGRPVRTLPLKGEAAGGFGAPPLLEAKASPGRARDSQDPAVAGRSAGPVDRPAARTSGAGPKPAKAFRPAAPSEPKTRAAKASTRRHDRDILGPHDRGSGPRVEDVLASAPPDLVAAPPEGRVVLLARDPEWAFVYWNLPAVDASRARLVIEDTETRKTVFSLEVPAGFGRRHVALPGSSRLYVARIMAVGELAGHEYGQSLVMRLPPKERPQPQPASFVDVSPQADFLSSIAEARVRPQRGSLTRTVSSLREMRVPYRGRLDAFFPEEAPDTNELSGGSSLGLSSDLTSGSQARLTDEALGSSSDLMSRSRGLMGDRSLGSSSDLMLSQ